MVRAIAKTFSRLPMPLLYGFADLCAPVLRLLVRYRLKVVRQNLASSFPERSRKELRAIERGYYRFLCDYFVETLKLLTISEPEMRRRMTFTGVDRVNATLTAGRSVGLFLGHYGNWEWVSTLPLWLIKEMEGTQIYKPLHSERADRLCLELRQRFGTRAIKMADTLRELVRLRRGGKPIVTGFISDQIPGPGPVHLWIDFLNHDTGVVQGAERIERMLHGSLYYCRMTRPSRGHYNCEFVPVSDDVATEPELEPTKRCFALLEEDIRRTPHLWLWSHRRWKRKRPAQNAPKP